jgi:hypothetical protein
MTLEDIVVVDIETAPMKNAEDFVEVGAPPKNYKKPETIQQWKDTAWHLALDKASLDPDLCRIVAIGSMVAGGPVQSMMARTESEEREMLRSFWRQITSDAILVGYNILQFDVPTLMRRSLYLGISNAPNFTLNKYRPSAHIQDLMLMLSMNGILKYRSLTWYARRFGIALPDQTIDGAMIPHLVEAGAWEQVAQHVEDDVALTARLAEKLGVLGAEQIQKVTLLGDRENGQGTTADGEDAETPPMRISINEDLKYG